MSNKISALVWEQAHCGGTRKLVLLALADAANQEGLCWPSIATIARMAGCSPRRAQEHISALVKLGWVTRSPSPGRSNNYMVHAPADDVDAAPDDIGPDAPSDEIADTTISQGCEISQGSDENGAEGCEISQGGVRNLAGGGAKSRRGGVRNLAPR
ncbi:MAG TPA: helix-turn-helix domain-containing protein, partial [Ktedonobacterales bacterium]